MMSASATIATANRASVSEQSEEQKMVKKVAVSSFLGNFIEWFDYASYSYFATTIALVFFPSGNHTVAMLQTFGVFALSFVLRQIGALFWGNFGDKKGRKGALAISIMFMSGASFLIGCLPSYAAIGIFAPALLLLLRMVQGFSASGALRMGVNEMTRFGFGREQFAHLAHLIADCILRNADVREEAARLREGFTDMRYCFSDAETEKLISALAEATGI